MREIRYGFERIDAGNGFVMGLATVVVVETRAIPRKWCIVAGRGRAIGRKNGSAMVEDFWVRAIAVWRFCTLFFFDLK